jgi:hypothetical protein
LTGAPDLIEPVLGFRKWRLREKRLMSPYVPVEWTERVLHASCHREDLRHTFFEQHWLDEPHRAPHPECKCGVYAYYEPRRSSTTIYLASIWGVVTVWGRIQAHRDGMRAEYARVEILAVFRHAPYRYNEAVRRIASDLGADVVDYDDMPDAALAYGKPLPPEMIADAA